MLPSAASNQDWEFLALPDTQETLDKMAGEIFELYRLIAMARSRQPAGHHDLSETEFLTLDALYKDQPQTIGEVQKRVGVVPAQMSRIVRALEQRQGDPFIVCKINPADRRRIDLTLTNCGKEAYENYRSNRLASMTSILQVLEPDDRLHFMRILGQIRTAFESRLSSS